MSGFGKKGIVDMNATGTRGVCTATCPYVCQNMANSTCKCSTASLKASANSKDYNQYIAGQRTPNF